EIDSDETSRCSVVAMPKSTLINKCHINNATLFAITRPFHPGSYQGIGLSTSLRASFQPSILTYATVGRNCYQGVRLLCSCAVPARDLIFRYLVARLKPCPDTNPLCKKIGS